MHVRACVRTKLYTCPLTQLLQSLSTSTDTRLHQAILCIPLVTSHVTATAATARLLPSLAFPKPFRNSFTFFKPKVMERRWEERGRYSLFITQFFTKQHKQTYISIWTLVILVPGFPVCVVCLNTSIQRFHFEISENHFLSAIRSAAKGALEWMHHSGKISSMIWL